MGRASGVSVEVLLPDRRRGGGLSSWASKRPQAQVVVDDGRGGQDTLTVPVSVGRSYATWLRGHEAAAPGSRNEVVYQLRQFQEARAGQRVADLLNRRDYSSKELADKLAADGYWRDVISSCLARCQDANLVNDARYADVFIRSKVSAGWGQARIAQGLAQRGIQADDLEGWPEAYLPQDEEADRAYQLASRRRYGGRDPYAKVVRFLCSRGFGMHLAQSVAQRMRDEGLLD